MLQPSQTAQNSVLRAWAVKKGVTLSIPRWPEVALFFWVLAICRETECRIRLQTQECEGRHCYPAQLMAAILLRPISCSHKLHKMACLDTTHVKACRQRNASAE